MVRGRSPEARAIRAGIQELDETLRDMREEVLRRAGEYAGSRTPNVHSFHGVIGGKNNDWADSVRTQFLNPQHFIALWLSGMLSRAEFGLARGYQNAAVRVARLLQDPLLRDYTFLFLERNFYRQLEARTRAKPSDALWKLWFGSNELVWGLLIAPARRGGQWTNDVSEIRRAKYQYWTIGHVLETGIIVPDDDEPTTFPTLGDLLRFYRTILRRLSKSKYERAIYERYEQYLEDSDDHDAEPFLIPELRYAGLEGKHKYRLDFAILNPHTMSYTGFELSPHSTHGAITGIKGKTLKEVNGEQAAR